MAAASPAAGRHTLQRDPTAAAAGTVAGSSHRECKQLRTTLGEERPVGDAVRPHLLQHLVVLLNRARQRAAVEPEQEGHAHHARHDHCTEMGPKGACMHVCGRGRTQARHPDCRVLCSSPAAPRRPPPSRPSAASSPPGAMLTMKSMKPMYCESAVPGRRGTPNRTELHAGRPQAGAAPAYTRGARCCSLQSDVHRHARDARLQYSAVHAWREWSKQCPKSCPPAPPPPHR